MSTVTGVNNEELISLYKEQYAEHEKLRLSYHRKKPEIKNVLLFGTGGLALGCLTANTLLAIANHKSPGSVKGYRGIANLLCMAVGFLAGALSGAGISILQKKINPEKYNQNQVLYDKETEILEDLDNKIEELNENRLSMEA